MAKITWIHATNGDFATGANWSTGTVPGAGDDAVFSLAGPYTVTSTANETVNSLQMAQGVTLAIGGGTFYAETGSGSGTDAGSIQLSNNTTFEAGGTIAGMGTIGLNSTGNTTVFQLETATVTLSGGGKLILNDNSNNYVYGASAADTLNNVSDTISGAGQLGDGQMSLANQAAGIINATGTVTQLILNFGTGTATNAGLIEATGAAGMSINSSTITQTGTGSLKSIDSVISLNNATIKGGKLVTTLGGVIQDVNTAEINGVTITAGSTFSVLNNTSLSIDNTITNAGSIALDSGGNSTDVIANTATTTLTGGGHVLLSDNSNNRIYGASSSAPFDTLVNVNNIISGSGQIGVSQMNLVNQAAGIIDATGTAAALTIQANSTTNAGLIEDTGTAGLDLNDFTVTNTGTIGAFGASAFVNLTGGVSVAGGTLATSGGGVIETTNSATLDGSGTGGLTITTGSQLLINNNDSLAFLGSIHNAGTLSFASGGNSTDFIVSSPTVTLDSGGTLLMSDNGNNRIYGAATAAPFDTLVNVNNTISGSGQIGVGQLNMVNQAAGVIDATGTAAGITLHVNALTNAGLLEDTNTGGLGITGTVITNTGTILATGTGSTVNFVGATSVAGGTLTANHGGLLETTDSATLDGSSAAVTLSTGSNFAIQNNEQLFLLGSIVNDGTFQLNSIGNGTDLTGNSATLTLSGGGDIVMSDNGNNLINSSSTADTIVNVNNIISGSGRIDSGQGSFVNQAAGVINSNGTGGLTILEATGDTFTNLGLIEDTNTGGLGFSAAVVANTGGTIEALGAGTSINIYGNSSIVGGTLNTSGGGVIETTNTGTLDGSGSHPITITTGSQVLVPNNDAMYLLGSIVNQGTISLASGGNGTDLIDASATLTLTGNGLIQLSDNGNNVIDSTAVGDVIDNVNNTITGSGAIDANQGSFLNTAGGIIDATGTAAGITIDQATGDTFTNAGLLEDTGTGGLGVNGATITNTGTIQAVGTGTSVNFYNGATDVGGLLASSNGGILETTNSATLNGSTSAVTLTAASIFQIQNNDELFLLGSIVNHGTFQLNSSGNGTDLIGNSATVTLSGGGNIVMTDNTNNAIYSASAADTIVNIDNTISGAGQIDVSQGSFVNQAAGVIDANGGNGLTIDQAAGDSFTNLGMLENTNTGGLGFNGAIITNTGGTIAALGAGTSVNVYNNASIVGGVLKTTGGGVIETSNNGTLDGSGSAGITIAAGSQVSVNNNADLYILGTLHNQGTISVNSIGNGTALIINSPTVTLSGAGSLVLGSNSNNAVYAAATTDKLINAGNTISGVGQLGDGQLTLVNQAAGTIDATGANALVISLGSTFNNQGLAEGTGSGGLSIQNETLTNTGTIAAFQGSNVSITSTTTLTNLVSGKLSGGTWEAIASTGTASSAVLSFAGGPITIDAAHLVLSGAGAAIIADGKALDTTLTTISAAGELDILGGYDFAGTTKLADSGNILLAGTLDATTLTVATTGTIDATGAGMIATGAFSNAGTLEASNGGTLAITQGSLKSTGTVIAQAGSEVSITGPARVTNLASGTLTGGTWAALGTGATLLISNGGSTIGTDAATLTLSGAGSTIESGPNDKTLQTTLANIATSGQLNVLAGQSFAPTAASFSDAGVISLGGGTFGGKVLAIASTGSFVGGGSLTAAVTDNGLLESQSVSNAGTLTMTGAITGTGSLVAGAATTLAARAGFAVGSVLVQENAELRGTGSATGAITIDGSLKLAGGAALTGGSITVGAAGLLSGFGSVGTTVANSGTILATGGTLTLAGETGGSLVSQGGANVLISTGAIAASTLAIGTGAQFTGFGSVSGATTDAGALAVTAGQSLALGNATGTGTASIANGATLSASSALNIAGVTFGAGSNESLALGTISGNNVTINGFASGTTIDLVGATVTSTSYSATTDQLTLKNGTTTLGRLQFAGTYTAHNFHVASDGHGGTDIVFAATAGNVVPVAALADLQQAAREVAAQPQAAAAPAIAANPAATMAERPMLGSGLHSIFDVAAHTGLDLHVGVR